MTPLEVTVKTLREHQLRMRGPVVSCSCGDFGAAVIPPHLPSAIHTQHQADMLAAAGVVMGVQEWGVRLRSDHPRITPTDDRADAEQRVKLARVRIYPHATVVTRWAGATEWVPA